MGCHVVELRIPHQCRSPFPIAMSPSRALRCPVRTPQTAAPAPGNQHAAQWGEMSSPHCVIHPGERPARGRRVALLVKSLGRYADGNQGWCFSVARTLLPRVSEIVAEFADEG